MRTIAANANLLSTKVKTIGDIVLQRHSPSFFVKDYVKIILPILQESQIGAAGVLTYDGQLAGLLTERTILRHVFAKTSDKTIHESNVEKYLDDMTVLDVMIGDPETLDESLLIEEAAGIMLRRGYRYMPVVSRGDRRRLLGIVSERELAIYLQERLQEVKRSEQEHKSMLSCLLREPYCSAGDPVTS